MMKMLLFGVIILVCANFLSSSDVCLSQTPCKCILADNSVIDLSSVGSPEFPRFYEVSYTNQCNITELYSYNPCFTFDSFDKHTVVKKDYKPCVGAAACIKGSGGSDGQFPEEHAIGLQSTAIFSSNESEQYITYTAPGSKKLIVMLTCNATVDHELRMDTPECAEGNGNIVLNLISKCACPNGCKSVLPTPSTTTGMSVGSKLLIAFFTILLAYFLVGTVWNYCNGSQGAEIIPNFEFWNDLPTLIMEGVVFTCSCCGRQNSYGAL